MQFSTLAIPSLFAILAAANPLKTRSEETNQVENLSIRDNNGIQGASFNLQPANVECSSADAAALADYGVVLCGETAYRFAVNGSVADGYSLRLYKELGPAFGLYGEVDNLPLYCHAGGNGVNDFICDQVEGAFITAVISS